MAQPTREYFGPTTDNPSCTTITVEEHDDGTWWWKASTGDMGIIVTESNSEDLKRVGIRLRTT